MLKVLFAVNAAGVVSVALIIIPIHNPYSSL